MRVPWARCFQNETERIQWAKPLGIGAAIGCQYAHLLSGDMLFHHRPGTGPYRAIGSREAATYRDVHKDRAAKTER